MSDLQKPGNHTEKPDRRWLVPLLLVIIAAAFYWPVSLQGFSPNQGDVPHQFLPWKVFWRASVLEGRIPLWNPHVACGAPFLANFQSSVFNPVDWLLLPVPPEKFFGVSLLVHTILGLLFTFALARRLGLGASGATIAALGFAFSGFNHMHLFAGNFLTFSATVWFPLLCWTTLGLIDSLQNNRGYPRALLWTWALCAAIVLQLLAGHPQMFFYSVFFTGLWALGLAWGTQRGRRRRLGKLAALLALAGIVAAAVCAVQLMPTLEYIRWSNRGEGLSFDEATQFSFSFTRLLALPLPDFFGSHAADNYWGYWKDRSSAYVGVWPCLLALVGLAWGWKRGKSGVAGETRGFPAGLCLVLATVAVLLAVGRHNPLYRWVLMLPGFGYFRAPSKFLPYFILPVCLLGGYGWNAVQALWSKKRDRRFWSRWSWVAIILFVFAAAALLKALRVPSEIPPSLMFRKETTIALAIGTACLFAGFGACLFVAGFSVKSRGRQILALLFCGLVTIDLYCYGAKYFRFGDPVDRWATLEQLTRPVSKDSQPGRLRTAPFGPNEAVVLGVETLGWYDPMSIRSYAEWIRYYEGQEPGGYSDGSTVASLPEPIFDLLNVRYRFEYLGAETLWKINRTVFPRVVFYPESMARFEPYPWVVDPSRELYLARRGQASAEWPPPPIKETLWRLSELSSTLPEQPAIHIDRERPERWRIDFDAPEPGYLFLSEAYYPGWMFILDDSVELEPLRANHAFRAVRAPAGRHSLEMVYRPSSFRIGTAISLVGGGIFVAWMVWAYRKRRG